MWLGVTTSLFFLLSLARWGFVVSSAFSPDAPHHEAVENFFGGPPQSGHTNNWAVLLCASRYWFNYRVSLRIMGFVACLTDPFYPQAYSERPWDVRST